jgi:hypothetical protein
MQMVSVAAPTADVRRASPLRVPVSVERALTAHGEAMPAALRADMEQRFGYDFSSVRVHTDGAAAQSALDVHARAYTAGNDIVFGAGQFSPRTAPGRRLLAHELAHVVQQSNGASGAVVRRDPLDDERVRKAMREQMLPPPGLAEKWGMGRPVAAAPGTHATPPGLEPKWQPRTLEEVIAASNVDPHRRKKHAEEAPIGDEDVMRMTGVQRLSAAVAIAKADDALSADLKAEIEALFTRQALFGMVVFAGLYLASQVTPAGWVADAIVLTSLTLAAFFIGSALYQILKDAGIFLSALNATTWQQLSRSGHALTRAVAKISVGLLVALITRTVKGAAKAYSEPPPPPGLADAVAVEGFVVRVPAGAAAVPQAPAVNMAGNAGVTGGVVSGLGKTPDPDPAAMDAPQGDVPKRDSGPYADIRDNTTIAPKRPFQPTQRGKIIAANRARNGGKLKSDDPMDPYQDLTDPEKSVSQGMGGSPQNPAMAAIDHIESQANGGTNAYGNARVISQFWNNVLRAKKPPK